MFCIFLGLIYTFASVPARERRGKKESYPDSQVFRVITVLVLAFGSWDRMSLSLLSRPAASVTLLASGTSEDSQKLHDMKNLLLFETKEEPRREKNKKTKKHAAFDRQW